MRDVWVGFTDPRVGVESDLLLATPRLPASDHRGFLPLPPLAAVLLLTRGLCRAGLARSPACAPHDRRRPHADAHKRGPVSHTDVTSDTTRVSCQSCCLNVGISLPLAIARTARCGASLPACVPSPSPCPSARPCGRVVCAGNGAVHARCARPRARAGAVHRPEHVSSVL